MKQEKRTFIIGDIHGMRDELASLLQKLSPEAGDRFFFLGDLVDKGPDSIGVISDVRSLTARFPGSGVVCGNHEDGVIRVWEKRIKSGSWDGIRKAEREPWLRNLMVRDREWLESLPLFLRPMPGVLLVHGGLFPTFFEKHGPIGELPAVWRRGGGKRMDRMRRFLRIRQIFKPGSLSAKGKDISGDMAALSDESDRTEQWGLTYDGSEGFVFFGHQPGYSGVQRYEHCMGIDTGCVGGGALTSVVLHEGSDPRECEIVSVPGRPISRWRG